MNFIEIWPNLEIREREYKIQREAENLAVLCINCEDYIEVEDISRHSGICYKLTTRVVEAEAQNTIDSSLTRIDRLKQVLERLLRRTQVPRERNYLTIMLRVCQKAVECRLMSSVNELDNYVKSLESSALHTKVSAGLQICADRLKALIHQHKAALAELEVVNVTNHILDLKNELKSYLKISQRLEADLKNAESVKVEQVNSEVCSVLSGVHSVISRGTEDSEDIRSVSQADLDDEGNQGDGQRRKFYSTALTCKMSYPHQHPIRKIPISKIYQLSLEKGIPKERWRGFITDFFNKVSHEENPRGMFSTITEGDEQETSYT